jgi:hypothetical protein
MSAKIISKNPLRFGAVLLAVVLVACVWVSYRVWPRELRLSLQPCFPTPVIQAHRLALPFSPEIAAAEVASFDDQLEAFLHLNICAVEKETAPRKYC